MAATSELTSTTETAATTTTLRRSTLRDDRIKAGSRIARFVGTPSRVPGSPANRSDGRMPCAARSARDRIQGRCPRPSPATGILASGPATDARTRRSIGRAQPTRPAQAARGEAPAAAAPGTRRRRARPGRPGRQRPLPTGRQRRATRPRRQPSDRRRHRRGRTRRRDRAPALETCTLTVAVLRRADLSDADAVADVWLRSIAAALPLVHRTAERPVPESVGRWRS
jgi:hypothetical protein